MYRYGDGERKAAETMFEELAKVEGVAESTDGLVRATTDRLGQLRELDLDPRIYHNRNAAGVARNILETVWDAAHDADRKAFRLLQPWLPPGATYADTDTVFDPLLYQLGRRARSRA